MCFLDPLDLNLKDYVFFPLNDNKSNQSAGGSHWSLLVADLKQSQFFHYDSISGSSTEHDARSFFQKYKEYFKINKFINAQDFPQQNNSSDCGVYVCGEFSFCSHFYNPIKSISNFQAATEIIANSLTNRSAIGYKSINSQYILDLRNRIKTIIINLSNQ